MTSIATEKALRQLEETMTNPTRLAIEESRKAAFKNAPSVPRLTLRRALTHPIQSIKDWRAVRVGRAIPV